MSARPVLPLLVGLLFSVLAPTYASTPRPLVANVDRVSDGDTLIATSANGTKLRIRHLGIDASMGWSGTCFSGERGSSSGPPPLPIRRWRKGSA